MHANQDQLKGGYLSKGILGKLYSVLDFIGYKLLNRNTNKELYARKLLFINLGLIGDLILFRYVIEDFLNYNYEIDVLIQDEYKFIFNNCHKVNLITIKGYKDKNILSGFYKIYTALRSNKKTYDVSCHFRAYLGTGILSTCLSGVTKYSIGYRTSGFGFLLSKVVNWRSDMHETEHLLDILRRLHPEYSSVNLNIFDNLTHKNYLDQFGLVANNYVVIHATSQDVRKNIPSQVLTEILQDIIQNSSLKIVFVGVKSEIDYIVKSVPANFDSYVIMNSKISFFDIRFLVSQARFFIGIDSSITHLVANIAVPKFILWHGLNSRAQWQPLGIDFKIILNNHDFESILEQIKKQ